MSMQENMERLLGKVRRSREKSYENLVSGLFNLVHHQLQMFGHKPEKNLLLLLFALKLILSPLH